jgi:hypothetical protein
MWHAWGGEKCLRGFGWEAHWEDLGVSEKIILKWTLGR